MKVCIVSGKRVRAGAILSGIHGCLRAAGVDVALHVVTTPAALRESTAGAALILHRSLGEELLSALMVLEDAGVRCCNRAAAEAALRDRITMMEALAGANVRVPSGRPASSWPDAIAAARGRPAVVKARSANPGRGAGVLCAPDVNLPADAPFDGPYLVQEFIPGDGCERKLYVVGSEVQGMIVDQTLSELARAAGAALQLEIYGVDVVLGPTGPVVVDVNAFPGFRRVPGAAALIADYVRSESAAG